MLNGDALAHWPQLRAVMHAAGSVKRLVTPAVWERGIRISSAAGVNAVPVAEYTLAAILLSARDVFRSARDYSLTHDMGAARPRGAVGAFGITVGVIGASRTGRRSLVLNLRPYLSGQPFRADHLDEVLTAIAALDQVWLTTPGAIVAAAREGAGEPQDVAAGPGRR